MDEDSKDAETVGVGELEKLKLQVRAGTDEDIRQDP